MRIKGLSGHENCTDTQCNGPTMEFACTTTDKTYTAATGCVTDVEYKCSESPDPKETGTINVMDPMTLFPKEIVLTSDLTILGDQGRDVLTSGIIIRSNGYRIFVNSHDPARSRFKYEVVKALEGMKRCQPSAWGEGECAACREGFNEDCTTKAIQECIETIKKL